MKPDRKIKGRITWGGYTVITGFCTCGEYGFLYRYGSWLRCGECIKKLRKDKAGS